MRRSVYILIALLIVIGINLVSYQIFTRFDFTEGNIYTLSESSKKIARTMPSDVKVKLFLSENLPPQATKIKQDLQDYLDEYAALSEGKLVIERLDPNKNEDAKILAQNLGIPPLQMQVLEKDQRQVVKVYMGLAVVQEKENKDEEAENPVANFEKYEILPALASLDNFEYDFTSALKKVSTEETKVLGFLTGHDEHEITSMQALRQGNQDNERRDYALQELLRKNYQVRTVRATEKTQEMTHIENEEADPEIEDDEDNEDDSDEESKENINILDLSGIDTLIVAGPKKALPDFEVQAIHEFVENGGNAIFLIDQVEIVRNTMAMKMGETFESLLAPWGISVSPTIVKDASHAQAAFSTSNGMFMSQFVLPYPFWVKVRNLNDENSITEPLESFVLPWTSPLKIQSQSDTEIDILGKTSEYYALAETETEVQRPVQKPEPIPAEDTTKVEDAETDDDTAAEKEPADEGEPAEGEDTESIAEEETAGEDIAVEEETEEVTPEPEYETVIQPTPVNLDPQQEFQIPREAKTPRPLVVQAQKNGQGKVIIVGDSDFIAQSFMGRFSENVLLFMNMVDTLNLGSDLIAIRSKGVTERPIEKLTEAQKNVIKWGNILFMPILVISFGLIRRALRNARKRRG